LQKITIADSSPLLVFAPPFDLTAAILAASGWTRPYQVLGLLFALP
jgi:hypothetical protein